MAQQIPRMGTIYSEVESVIIWLALSSEEKQQLQIFRQLRKEKGWDVRLYPYP